MNANNEPIFTKEEDAELEGIFANKKAAEEAEQARIKAEMEKQKIKEIIASTEEIANSLYPDIATVNPKKSISQKKVACSNAKEILSSVLIFGTYFADDVKRESKNFKKETGINIGHVLALTSIIATGTLTIGLNLPSEFFINFGVTPAIVTEIATQIKIFLEKKATQKEDDIQPERRNRR